MDEKELNLAVTDKYMTYNDLLMTFLRENMRHGRSAGNPNRGQGKVLSILRQTPVLSQKELVSQLEIKPQSASELIRKLENKGYLERTPNPDDRRILMVSLTKSGQVIANKNNEFEPVFLNALNRQEKEQFEQILDKLLAEIEPEVAKLRRKK